MKGALQSPGPRPALARALVVALAACAGGCAFEGTITDHSTGDGAHRPDGGHVGEGDAWTGGADAEAPPDLEFSRTRGFFASGFELLLTSRIPDGEVRFTTDGSAPSASRGEVYVGPIEISTTTIVRALVVVDGVPATGVETHTFIFAADVVEQGGNPPGYPDSWGLDIKDVAVAADYEMDPRVLADHPDMAEVLRDLPTLSVAMDPRDFLDTAAFPEGGIYYGANSLHWGEVSERLASIELINPDGTTAFQEDCGIRIAGAASRDKRHTVKHSFTLKFREAYGDSKLRYPMFPNSSATKFDTIRLRAGMNDAFGNDTLVSTEHASYLRDQWARDTQRDMGWLAADGIYVHLYINGMYWGLYNASERPDASFMAQRLGGEKDDYDVLSNPRRSTHLPLDESSPRISDGNDDAWSSMLAIDDWGSEAGYEAVKAYLDVTQQIDYIIIEVYAANIDWATPTRPIEGRNWRAGRRSRNRSPGDAQFQFFIWDVETAMGTHRDDPEYVSDLSNTGGIWQIHERLLANPAYRAEFAERVQLHFFDGGALTPEAALARFETRVQELGRALIPESARWGDQMGSERYTYETNWLPEIEYLRDVYFPNRSAEVVQQFRDRGLY